MTFDKDLTARLILEAREDDASLQPAEIESVDDIATSDNSVLAVVLSIISRHHALATQLEAALVEIEHGRTMHPSCSHCERNPATCLGCYEDHAREDCTAEGCTQHDDSWACDECCGHGCEDGHCTPIEDLDGYATTLGINIAEIMKERDQARAECERLRAVYEHALAFRQNWHETAQAVLPFELLQAIDRALASQPRTGAVK